MLEQRLIILVSVATAVKFGGWTGSVAGFWGPVQFRAPGVLRFRFFIVLRDCLCHCTWVGVGLGACGEVASVFAWVLGFGVGYLGGHFVHGGW